MKRYLKPETIAGNLIIPTALLLGYSGLFIALNHFLSPYLSTDNVNYYFVRALITLAIPVLLVSLLALGWLVIRRGRAPHSVPESGHRKGEVPASLLIALLPLAPVIRYLFSNQDILSLFDVIVLLVGCLGVSIALVVAIPALLRKYSSFRLLASTAGAFVFTIVNMAAISGLFRWLEKGNAKSQLLMFALVLAILWLLLGLKNKKDLAFVVVAFVVSNAALMPFSQNKPAAVGGTEAIRLEDLVSGTHPTRSPNIYLLIYDAYVSNETMLSYGLDNSEQEAFLVEQGFTLYPHTYSVGASSLDSMNRVLSVAHDYPRHNRDSVSGNGVVHELLHSTGYQTIGIFPYDYMFRGTTPKYDYYTPRYAIPSYQLLFWGMWMGEFRFDIGFQTISHEEYVQAKREVFTSPGESPIFLYTHSTLPGHSQNSGACLPNETELFAERLQEANSEMRDDIAAIVANDPDAIVIVASDHGPYLTKNCTDLGRPPFDYDSAEITRADIQDRNGAFLAVRWPAEDFSEYDQITVLQDIFPAVFAWMYRDPSLLEAKVEPNTELNWHNGGVGVNDGVIVGGADDGEPLYLSGD